MMKRILLAILFIFTTCVFPAFAIEKVKIGDLYYNLNFDDKTAEVTYENRTIGSNYTGLTVVSIPKIVTYNSKSYKVTRIGSYSFDLCANVISVIVPNSILSIGEEAFDSRKMVSIDVASDNPNYASINGVLFDKNISTLVRYPSGKKGAYSIPNTVSVIGEYAFEDCKDLTSIIIPNSVTSIGVRAFHRCHGLTSITIPQSVTSIENQAFYYCDGLTSVTLPDNVTNIASFAFRSCHNLKSPIYNAHCFVCMPQSYKGAYTIPNGIESIAGGAFYQCSQLTSVNIPNSVTSIGVEAFKGCSKLTSPVFNAHCFAYLPRSYKGAFTIPDGIESIAPYAFENCENLTSVTIPNSVISIGSDAFALCKGLTSITIPNSVTSIGYGAFFLCKGLTFVTIGNSVTSIGDETFSCCNSLQEIVYPQGLDISKAGIPSSTKLIAYTPTNSSTNTATASSRSTSNTNSATTSRTAATQPSTPTTKPISTTPTIPTKLPECRIDYSIPENIYHSSSIRLCYSVDSKLSDDQEIEFLIDGTRVEPKTLSQQKGVRPVQCTEVELDNMPTIANHVTKVSIRIVDKRSRISWSEKSIALKYQSIHKPTLHVFAVGVNKYKAKGFDELRYAEKDARDFSKTIIDIADKNMYERVDTTVILGSRANRSYILAQLMKLEGRVKSNDIVMLFFSGHGKVENGKSYFITSDAEYVIQGLATRDIVDQIELMKKRSNVFVFMDACHSGATKTTERTKGNAKPITLAESEVIGYYSCAEKQESIEDEKLENGVFTYALVKGLKGTAANEGQITIYELAEDIRKWVREKTNGRQSPTLDYQGDDYVIFYKKK